MFTILNRLRGTWGRFSKVVGILIAIMVYIVSDNYYTAIASGLGYIAGESMGWGAWVGTLSCYPRGQEPKNIKYGDEGMNNGIHWLASKLVDPISDWYKFSVVALGIRGIYWWLPVALPLTYLYGILPVVIALVLGILFPVACILGYKFRGTKIGKWTGGWEISELIYGAMQDVALVIGVLIILCIN